MVQQYYQNMSGQSFRNLMKPVFYSDDSFTPLLKKGEEIRKLVGFWLDFFQSIAKNSETHELANDKLLYDFHQEVQEEVETLPQYYQEYLQLFRNLESEHKNYSHTVGDGFTEFAALSGGLVGSCGELLMELQGQVRGYRLQEQGLLEMGKRYSRSHKNMLTCIESYKSSFTDVKLIYNMDEKHRRYASCEGNYRNLQEELGMIEERILQLGQEKQVIGETYRLVEGQIVNSLRSVANRVISQCRNIVYRFCQMLKVSTTYLAQRKFTLQNLTLQSFFGPQALPNQPDLFKVPIDRSQCQLIPALLVYNRQLKEEYYPQVAKILNNYLKELTDKIEKRKWLNKRMIEFTSNYFKLHERAFSISLREVVAGYEKNRKKLIEAYGSKLCNFIRSIASVFDLSVSTNDKLAKKIANKLKSIENTLIDSSKVLDIFMKELRGSIEKLTKKKELRRIFSGEKEAVESPEEENITAVVDIFKAELAEKAEYITHLIEGFDEKVRKSNQQIKVQYNSLVADLSSYYNEFYTLSWEFHEVYFGEEFYGPNFAKFQEDIEITLKKENKFFEETAIAVILKEDTGKVTFDAELNKIEEFKKLKKPVEMGPKDKQEKPAIFRKSCVDEDLATQSENKSSVDRTSFMSAKQELKQKDLNKYEEFLKTKFAFMQEEKFFNTYACGLSDKIILQGRLYITSQRLCFYSKFNTTNVFFGQTFIQIPKKDIIKVQKRASAIVFDNSISITTVNGQFFLTSFFSRNEAYDTIYQALELSNDEVMFEPEQLVQEKIEQEQMPTLADDDLKEEDIPEREARIIKMLDTFEYKQLFTCEFTSENLNALKFFKIFELNHEFIYNRKTFKNFGYYIKDCFEHKDSEISDWSPSITQYLNPTNLKNTIPDKFQRKIRCLVPITNSGVPFMPKHAKSDERVSLFFVSKDKYIIETTIQNSGVPYSDTFNIRMQKIVETVSQNKCRFTVLFFVNFHTSTIMRSIIETRSADQTKMSQARFEEEVKKYIKHMEKLKAARLARTESSAEKVIGCSQNEEKEDSLSQNSQSELLIANKHLQAETKQLQGKLQHYKYILLGSLAINVLFILLLLL